MSVKPDTTPEKKKIHNFLLAIPVFYLGLAIFYGGIHSLTSIGLFPETLMTEIVKVITSPIVKFAILMPIIFILLLLILSFEKVLDYTLAYRDKRKVK